jgi:uncharacterized protein
MAFRFDGDAGFYVLHCRAPSGAAVRLFYNPHTSELKNEDGTDLIADTLQEHFEPASRISPAQPGTKSASPATLKIQLGLQCNYACSYCSQTGEIGHATVTPTAAVEDFLRKIDRQLKGEPERIEFWGGEPFVYFAKLKRLVPTLRQRFPAADLHIVTNGSLLDTEIITFIEEHDIFIAVSHDGPGQSLRGPDPFDDPVQGGHICELWRRRGPLGKMTFNIVFSARNSDVRATYAWFQEKLGDADVALSTEGIVSVYDERTLRESGCYSTNEYGLLRRSMIESFMDGSVALNRSVVEKAEEFVDALHLRRPSSALGQKCGMDRDDQLAVDLSGQVTTCQNTGAKGKHGIGSLDDLTAVRLDTAWHWSHRESCNHCPVLQLCKGSCMYLEEDLFAQSCENEYRYNEAILAGIIKRITDFDLMEISGDIRRPLRQRTIPIRPVE